MSMERGSGFHPFTQFEMRGNTFCSCKNEYFGLLVGNTIAQPYNVSAFLLALQEGQQDVQTLLLSVEIPVIFALCYSSKKYTVWVKGE